MRISVPAAIIACATAACAAETRTPELEHAYDLTAGPDAAALEVLRAGGLSGLAITPAGELLAVSDDSVGARLLMLRAHENPFRLEPTGSIWFYDVPERIDPEAIVLMPDGHLLVASEGEQDEEPRTAPGIVELTGEGEFVRVLNVRNRYVPPVRGPLTAGVRPNASFESLTLRPGGKQLFTATETALVQDGPAADFDRGARVRILEYVAQGDSFQPAREWAYDTDPVARPDFPTGLSNGGLVELVALEDGGLLALERSYAAEADDGIRSLLRIRVYRISLEGATDVSSLDSLAGRTVRPVSKQLVMDLDQIAGLPPALSALENFEGMALAAGPDGAPRLWLVSDDNFSLRQHTWFLRFRF